MSSSTYFKEELMFGKKQGIVSIIGSADAEAERKPNYQSLIKTISADMSSKKWLSQNGFSISARLKRIASSEEFPVIVDSASSAEIWNSIQQEKQKKESAAPGQFDIWNSILTQKEAQEETKNPLPPNIHPLIKRSSSSLSEKSLEICTESLGSETGADGFSSHPPSEIGDAEEDGKGEEEKEKEKEKDYNMEDWEVSKNNKSFSSSGSATMKLSPRLSFPPPLPSLSSSDGASLRMKPHRDNGRLVLEAISFPSQNNFKADRQEGRLVLSFINSPDEVEVENSASAQEDEMKKEKYIMEQPPNDFISVHKLAFIMNKPMVLANKNPAWSNKFNEIIKFGEQKLNPIAPVARIFPAVASLNAYECYWKSKPQGTGTGTTGVTAYLSPITNNKSNNNYTVTKHESRKEIVASGNKGDRFVFSLLKECKEPRIRSLFSFESHCIATS